MLKTDLSDTFPNCLFDTVYDGYPARKVTAQANANRFMDFLTLKSVPYRLKIVRKRQEPAFFLFQLVGTSVQRAGGYENDQNSR